MKHAQMWVLMAALVAVALLWRSAPDLPEQPTVTPNPSPAPAADSTGERVFGAAGKVTSLPLPPPPLSTRSAPRADAPPFERQLGMLLSQDRFQDAVNLYDQQHGRIDDASQRRYRDFILRFADSAARNDELDRAADLLEIYTGLFFKDVAALSLLAEVLHRDERYQAEIDVLYAALNEAHLQADRRRLRDRLDRAVANAASRINEQQGPPAVIRFYLSLLQGEPLHGPYQIALAHAYIKSNETEAAQAILDGVTDPAFLDQAADLRNRLDARLAGEVGIPTKVPLQPVAGGYAVPVIINGRVRATLLIDTGASLTIISPAVLRRAGVALERTERQGRFNTVNGVITAPIARLRTLALSRELVENIDVGGIALPGVPGIDGLLGMNVLRRFEFSVSDTEQLLTLAPLTRTGQQAR